MNIVDILKRPLNVKEMTLDIPKIKELKFDPFSYLTQTDIGIINENLSNAFKNINMRTEGSPCSPNLDTVLPGYFLFPKDLPTDNDSWQHLINSLGYYKTRDMVTTDSILEDLIIGKLVFGKTPRDFGKLVNKKDFQLFSEEFVRNERHNQEFVSKALGKASKYFFLNDFSFPGMLTDRYKYDIKSLILSRDAGLLDKLKEMSFEELTYFRLSFPSEFKEFDIRDKSYWEKTDNTLRSMQSLFNPYGRAHVLLKSLGYVSIIAADEIKVENGKILLINKKNEPKIPMATPIPVIRRFE